MKKIMFNEIYRLQTAVLERWKTMTRRSVSEKLWDRWTDYDDWCNTVAVSGVPTKRQYYEPKGFFLDNSPYKVGEVVAIAQSYKDAGYSEKEVFAGWPFSIAGWNNKLFVAAGKMPHHIRITDVKTERLQDISDDDCLKEGIKDYSTPNEKRYGYSDFKRETIVAFRTPREAFSNLIDKVSGKGTWDSNPWVFAYEFELVD